MGIYVGFMSDVCRYYVGFMSDEEDENVSYLTDNKHFSHKTMSDVGCFEIFRKYFICNKGF